MRILETQGPGFISKQHDSLAVTRELSRLNERPSFAISIGRGIPEEGGNADILTGEECSPLDLVLCRRYGSLLGLRVTFHTEQVRQVPALLSCGSIHRELVDDTCGRVNHSCCLGLGASSVISIGDRVLQ